MEGQPPEPTRLPQGPGAPVQREGVPSSPSSINAFLFLKNFPTTLRNFLLIPEEFPHIVCLACQARSQAQDRGGTHQIHPRPQEDTCPLWVHLWEAGGGHEVLEAGCAVPQSICTDESPTWLVLFLSTSASQLDSLDGPPAPSHIMRCPESA